MSRAIGYISETLLGLLVGCAPAVALVAIGYQEREPWLVAIGVVLIPFLWRWMIKRGEGNSYDGD